MRIGAGGTDKDQGRLNGRSTHSQSEPSDHNTLSDSGDNGLLNIPQGDRWPEDGVVRVSAGVGGRETGGILQGVVPKSYAKKTPLFVLRSLLRPEVADGRERREQDGMKVMLFAGPELQEL